jgi:hypothetical protein
VRVNCGVTVKGEQATGMFCRWMYEFRIFATRFGVRKFRVKEMGVRIISPEMFPFINFLRNQTEPRNLEKPRTVLVPAD